MPTFVADKGKMEGCLVVASLISKRRQAPRR